MNIKYIYIYCICIHTYVYVYKYIYIYIYIWTGSVSVGDSPAGVGMSAMGVRADRRQMRRRPAPSTVPAGANCRSGHWRYRLDAAQCKLRVSKLRSGC